MNMFRSFFNTLLDIILPQNQSDARSINLSESDIAELPRSNQISNVKNINSIFSYRDDRVRSLIWRMKYRGDQKIARIFGRIMAEHIFSVIEESTLEKGNCQYALVPIPVSKKRRRERGFNQCELIAKTIAREHPDIFRVANVLVKGGGEEHQARMRTKAERMKNVRGTFSVESIPNMPIIIIDDVTTTGATIEEAMRVLHEAGAKDIQAFTFAH
jgi:competence protein ComFC